MRLLKPDPVPKELVDRLMWAATRAPSPGNSQGWDFVVVDEAEPKGVIASAISVAMSERVAAMPRPDRTTRLMLDGTAAMIDTLDQAPLPMAEAVALEGGRAANADVLDAYRQYYAYFGPHIQQRADAIEAGDDVPDDLLTRLLTVERDGNKLSQQQVVGFCQFLLVAGSATTTLLIGNLISRLMRHPSRWRSSRPTAA